jgi:hypothetical protein
MNQDQFLGVVRNLVALASGVAIGHGWLTAEQITLIGGAMVAVWPLLSSYFAHSNLAKLLAAASVPEVKAIVVEPNGNRAMESAAHDPAMGKIIKEGDQPR